MVKAENPRDSWDYRDGSRENQSCVLPERRGAMWSRLLIVETHKKEKKNVDDNMVMKIVNGHVFGGIRLKTHARTHLSMQPVGARVLISRRSPTLAL